LGVVRTGPTAGGSVIFTHTADLRLVHCLLHDDVKQAFISRHDCLDRRALDARNSPQRPKTWLEQIAAKFNSEDFRPESEVFPNLHNDFAEPINLSLHKCPGKVTTDQVKVWIADRKAKLVLLIDRWERSGNGDGQRLDTDNQFGSVGDIHYQGDDRASFLKTERPTLLYYWNMLIKYDILQETVSILPNELAASSSSGNLEPSAENSRVSLLAVAASSSTTAYSSKNRNKKRKNDGSVDPNEREQRTSMFQEKMMEMVVDEKKSREDERKFRENERKSREEERKSRDDERKLREEEERKLKEADRKVERQNAAEVRCTNAEESWLRLVSLVAGATNPGIKAMYESRLEVALQRLKAADAQLKGLS
jgi:hypothetical protein